MSEIKITCDNCNGSGESTRGYDQCGECNGKGYHLQEMPVANKMSEFKAKTDKPLKFEQVLADTHTELDKAKQTVAELHVVIAEFRKSAEATEAELDTVKAELGRGKWVSVSEPPKSNGKYLVWDVNGLFDDKNELATYVVYNDHWYNESNDMSIHPTHWQPLPTPPHKN